MSKRDDDKLINYIVTGLQRIVRGAERALQGNERFWAYSVIPIRTSERIARLERQQQHREQPGALLLPAQP